MKNIFLLSDMILYWIHNKKEYKILSYNNRNIDRLENLGGRDGTGHTGNSGEITCCKIKIKIIHQYNQFDQG